MKYQTVSQDISNSCGKSRARKIGKFLRALNARQSSRRFPTKY